MNAVTQIPETGHATHGPSGANTWTLCPGSIAAQQGFPDTDNEHSLRGTAAHTVVEDTATGVIPFLPPPGYEVSVTLVSGERTTIVLTEEDLAAIQIAVNFVKEQNVGDCQFMAEHRTDPGPACQATDMWGTVDLRFYYPAAQYLHIADYKHGRSPVEITDNRQLLLYAIGEADALIRAGQQVNTVRMTIIQPRRSDGQPAISSVEMPINDLWNWVPVFSKARLATDVPGAPRTAGEAQCKWCRAAPTCPEAGGSAIADVTQIQQPLDTGNVHIPEDPAALSPAQLATAARHFARLRSWMDTVEAYMLKTSLDGSTTFQDDTGALWGPVAVNSPRRWTFGRDATMAKLSNRLKAVNNKLDKGQKLTISTYRGHTLLTFNQVFANINKSVLDDEEKGKLIDFISKTLVEKPTGKVKLGVLSATAIPEMSPAPVAELTPTETAPAAEDYSFLD